MIIKIVITLNIFLLLTLIVQYILSNYKYFIMYITEILSKMKFTKNIDSSLSYFKMYFPMFKGNKVFNSIKILILSVICSLISYSLSILIIKIQSTCVILSIISFFIPYFLINICVNNKIRKIKTILPSYIVNLKNNIEVSNNILDAIRVTKVQEPLSYSISKFNFRIQNGVNVSQCFEELKKEINIVTFHSLIDAFNVCYENGGNFNDILTRYIDIVSKENLEKAKLKENSSTTIITLVIMIVINALLLFSSILTNAEYRETILHTNMGHVIINFSILSYVLVGFFVYKIFKMEE